MGESRQAGKATVLIGLVLASCAVFAQDSQPLDLNGILQRLESNLLHYHAEVPSFFCDEHVVSRQRDNRGGGASTSTVTDSTFRLKRTPNHDGTVSLVESREVKAVNGNPVTGDSVTGPAILQEAFASGQAYVSPSQADCMRYTLEPIKPGTPIIIRFSTLPGKPRPGCLLQEQGDGRALINPDNLQITRIEFTAPHHIITVGSRTQLRMEGSWNVGVDYAPVELEGQTFWMPKRISSLAVSPSSDGGSLMFLATYTNFHKLEVTTTILPAKVTPTQ